jgi:hypothetical protein
MRRNPRFGAWIFFISFLVGNLSLLLGLNDQGAIAGTIGFGGSCIIWWAGYRLGGTSGRVGTFIGLLALSIWTIDIVLVIFSFRRYVSTYFLWITSASVAVLMAAFVLSEARRGPAEPS